MSHKLEQKKMLGLKIIEEFKNRFSSSSSFSSSSNWNPSKIQIAVASKKSLCCQGKREGGGPLLIIKMLDGCIKLFYLV